MSRDEIEASTIRPPRRGECDQIAGTATTQVFRARASVTSGLLMFRPDETALGAS